VSRVFRVSRFREDDDGKALWPGFDENCRIIKWIFERLQQDAGAVHGHRTLLGLVPSAKDIDVRGIIGNVTVNDVEKALVRDPKLLLAEMQALQELSKQLGEFPQLIREQIECVIAECNKQV
jgi:phosphoenolpyruvate carboxykinase (GTP)